MEEAASPRAEEPRTLPPASTPGSIPALLEPLGQLHTYGVLTDEEFQQKKAELLQRM